MELKTTKGEWFIESNFCTLDVSSKSNGIVCSVECSYQLSEQLIDPTEGEMANAHLIAAAPALYKFIEDQILLGLHPTEEEKAIKLLAKARGE